MEVIAIIIPILVFALIVGFLVLSVLNKKNHLSGEYGERRTAEMLKSLMQEGEIVINDYLAGRNKNNTSSIQIDHIFISHKGIFVIETKDYRGRIYGSNNQTYWTQVLAYGNTKNKLYNPVKQNETHCNYLGRLLNWTYPMHNIVIFISADTSRVTDSNDNVFDLTSFQWCYKRMPLDPFMTNEAIERIEQIITKEMNDKQITKEEHIYNVRRKHN